MYARAKSSASFWHHLIITLLEDSVTAASDLQLESNVFNQSMARHVENNSSHPFIMSAQLEKQVWLCLSRAPKRSIQICGKQFWGLLFALYLYSEVKDLSAAGTYDRKGGRIWSDRRRKQRSKSNRQLEEPFALGFQTMFSRLRESQRKKHVRSDLSHPHRDQLSSLGTIKLSASLHR